MSVSEQPVPKQPIPAPTDPPDDAERPVALTEVPEGTSRPRDWDVDGASTDGPAHPHREDDVREEQIDAQRAERRARADGDPATGHGGEASGEDESAYTTEVDQGAAQPVPDDPGTGHR